METTIKDGNEAMDKKMAEKLTEMNTYNHPEQSYNIHARIYFMARLRRVGVYVDYSIIPASSFTIERGLEVHHRNQHLLHHP